MMMKTVKKNTAYLFFEHVTPNLYIYVYILTLSAFCINVKYINNPNKHFIYWPKGLSANFTAIIK